MRIAMLAPIAWRTPPRHYGPWENIVSLLTEGLVARGFDVTLFATGNSETHGTLQAVCAEGYEENRNMNAKVWESLHISNLFEQAHEFELIHNHFDFLPLTYSGLVSTPVVTTIHGFSSPDILPVYQKYNRCTAYIAISDADRAKELDYIATIHHGINLSCFDFRETPDGYLLFFGRIHPDKGAREAIEIARACNLPLRLAGIIQDSAYFKQYIEPELKHGWVDYLGSVEPAQRSALLGGASALLHPIAFNEPFGLSIIEAMACGTPTIAFNRGSMPELIDHGTTGFLVTDCAEAIVHVGRIKEIDRTQCRRMAETRFTADRMVEQYIEAYRNLLRFPSAGIPKDLFEKEATNEAKTKSSADSAV